jgi:uncharacterized protein YegP (UPF0339 family)
MKSRYKFVIERAANKEFFVRIISRNSKQTFTSGEQYKRTVSASKAISSLISAIKDGEYVVVDNS